MIVQPGGSSRVNSSRELYCRWLFSCWLMPRIAILCLPQQFKAIQSTAIPGRTKTFWGGEKIFK